MDDFEQLANRVNDTDLQWWPFLFLRPEPHCKLSRARVFALAALYGVFGGMLANALLSLTGHSRGVHLAVLPAAAPMVLFVTFRWTSAWAWNRRADRLAPTPYAQKPRDAG